MKYFIPLIAVFILSCKTNSQKQFIGKDSTTIMIVDGDDKEMDLAIFNARSTLHEFDSVLSTNDPAYNSFALKVRFPYGDNNGEHIWLTGIEKNKAVYVGIIDNTPEYVSNLQLGDTVKINSDDISDWLYFNVDKMVGGFTIRLLESRMEKE